MRLFPMRTFFRVWKQVKLSGSSLSTFHGFGSTQLSIILMPYPCSDILLTKKKVIKVCPKYLLTFYQNLYSQYQKQINVAQAKSNAEHNYPGYIHNVAESLLFGRLFKAAHDLTAWPSG